MAKWCRKCIYLKPKLQKLFQEEFPGVPLVFIDVNAVPGSLVTGNGIRVSLLTNTSACASSALLAFGLQLCMLRMYFADRQSHSISESKFRMCVYAENAHNCGMPPNILPGNPYALLVTAKNPAV